MNNKFNKHEFPVEYYKRVGVRVLHLTEDVIFKLMDNGIVGKNSAGEYIFQTISLDPLTGNLIPLAWNTFQVGDYAVYEKMNEDYLAVVQIKKKFDLDYSYEPQ